MSQFLRSTALHGLAVLCIGFGLIAAVSASPFTGGITGKIVD